jgi:integrase
MRTVGRKRKDGNPLGLERRVEFHHGQFRYLHRDGRKESLGADLKRANQRARLYNDPREDYGTVGYYLELFLADARAGRLPAGRKLSERTIADYDSETANIKISPIGKLLPTEIVLEPNLLSEYRDRRVSDEGKGQVQANHGLALLSSMFSWLIEKGHCPGLLVNPVKAIKRFARRPKDRYVEDHEYQPAYVEAIASVRMAMALVYSTLQRPSDVLGLPPSPARAKTVAGKQKRILPVRQSKTGRTVDIEVTPELEQMLGMLAPAPEEKVVKLPTALVHGRGGKPYTEDGMAAMLRRYCIKAKVRPFGLMDVRAKGATDMYLRGVPLEQIQMLMGHKSVQTTEIYIKRLLGTISTVAPNSVAVGN